MHTPMHTRHLVITQLLPSYAHVLLDKGHASESIHDVCLLCLRLVVVD